MDTTSNREVLKCPTIAPSSREAEKGKRRKEDAANRELADFEVPRQLNPSKITSTWV